MYVTKEEGGTRHREEEKTRREGGKEELSKLFGAAGRKKHMFLFDQSNERSEARVMLGGKKEKGQREKAEL